MKKIALFLFSMMNIAPHFAPAKNNSSAVQEMLGYFGGRCSINGSWTEAITDSVNKISAIVQSMNNDSECQSVSGLVNQLNTIRSRIDYLKDENNEIQIRISSLQSRQREIVFLLQQSPNATDKAALESDLVQTQLSLASAQGEAIGNDPNENLRRKENAYFQIVNSTNSILRAVASQQACWGKKPGLLENVASLGGAVAQSLSLTPALSTGSLFLGAGAGLFTGLIEALEHASHEREQRRIIESISSSSLSCALENLNNIYCGASETLDLIEITRAERQQAQNANDTNPLKSSQNIIRYDLPVINDWINKVKAGDDPNSSSSADERRSIRRREISLQNDLTAVIGLINSKRNIFSQATDREKQWTIIRKTIIDIGKKIFFTNCESGSCSMEGSLTSITSVDTFPYRLLGLSQSQFPRSNNQLLAFDQFDGESTTIVFSLDSILNEYKKLNNLAQELVNQELNETVNPDKKRVFLLAVTATNNGQTRGLSPLQAFGRVKNYLSQNQSRILSSNTASSQSDPANIYSDTIQMISKIESIIQQVSTANTLTPDQGLSQISELIQLSHTSTYFQDRIRQFVRLNIQKIIEEPNQLQNPAFSRWISSQDVLDEISTFTGKDQTLMKLDADNAISIYQQIYPKFLEIFKRPIIQSLKDFDSIISLQGSSSALNLKSVLCSHLVGQNSWKDSIGLSFCNKTQVQGVDVSTPVLTKAYFESTDYKARICSYRNMLRRSAIKQGQP